MKKGFTIIELLAVLVILAIISTIATTMVLNIINSSKHASEELSMKNYIEELKLSQANYRIKNGGLITNDINKLEINISELKDPDAFFDKDGNLLYASAIINGHLKTYTKDFGIEDKGKSDNLSPILSYAKSLVYENNDCKADGTTYEYLGGCYIKGKTSKNYIWFNGFIYRIMGINKDGSVRLITDENVTTIHFNAKNKAEDYKNSFGRKWLNEYFYENIQEKNKALVKAKNDSDGLFCMNGYVGDATLATNQTCDLENIINDYVGTLSLYEYILCGGVSSYLHISQSTYTMTYASTSNMWGVNCSGPMGTSGGIRAIVNVKPSTIVTAGDGSRSNYYVLDEDKSVFVTGTLIDNVKIGEYIKYANKVYRVVEKSNDGIKMILDGYSPTALKYYDSEVASNYDIPDEVGIPKGTLYYVINDTDFINWITENSASEEEKLSDTTWYRGNKYVADYEDSLKNTNPYSKKGKVGLIRIGEILSGQSSTIIYRGGSYHYNNANRVWTNSYYSASLCIEVEHHSYLSATYASSSYRVRPVINVKPIINIVKGSGTSNKPYEI